MVAQRFHRYCLSQGILTDKRLPRHSMQKFIDNNIHWKRGTGRAYKRPGKEMMCWYRRWSSSAASQMEALQSHPVKRRSEKSKLGSRSH